MRSTTLKLAAICLIGIIGCEKSGPAEKAGARVDEIVDNVKHGDAPLKEKGKMEKVGESIDDTVKSATDKVSEKK